MGLWATLPLLRDDNIDMKTGNSIREKCSQIDGAQSKECDVQQNVPSQPRQMNNIYTPVQIGTVGKIPLFCSRSAKWNCNPLFAEQAHRAEPLEEQLKDILQKISGIKFLQIQDGKIWIEYEGDKLMALLPVLPEELPNQLKFINQNGKKVNVFFEGGRLSFVGYPASEMTDHYDEEKRFIYRNFYFTEENGGGVKETLFVGADGQLFNPAVELQTRSPDELVAFLKEKIKRPESLLVFENLFFIEDRYKERRPLFNEDIVLKFRAYAKEVLELEGLERALDQKYNVEIETERGPQKGLLQYDRASLADLKIAMESLEKSLEIYPPGFLERNGLKNIAIFKGIKEGMPAGGLSDSSGNIMLSVSENIQWASHHELYHTADFNDNLFSDDNFRWGIEVYGENYSFAYVETTAKERPSGFATPYAFKGIGMDEDQADTAAAMLLDYNRVVNISHVEPALARKIRFSKFFYYVKSEGKMDEIFWKDLALGEKIDAAYWKKRDHMKNFVSDDDGKQQLFQYHLAEKAYIAANNNDYDEAKKDWKKLIQLFPGDPYSYLQLASLYERSGDQKKAIEYYEGAAMRQTVNPLVYEKLMALYSKRGDAVQTFERLVKAGVKTKELYATLASLYLNVNEIDEIFSLYQKPIEEGHRFFIYHFFAFAYQHQSVFKADVLDRMLKLTATALQTGPPDAVFFSIVTRLVDLQKKEIAVNLLKTAIQKNPENNYLKARLQELL